jgi:hypothetical protein
MIVEDVPRLLEKPKLRSGIFLYTRPEKNNDRYSLHQHTMNTNELHLLAPVFGRALALIVLIAPSNSRAGEPGPTDYFKAGEAMAVVGCFPYYTAMKDQLKTKYAELRNRLVTAKAPERVLADFDKYAAVMQSLPWAKSYADWTKEDKERWNKTILDWDLFNSAWLNAKPEASYFFWLGNKVTWISYNIPTYIDSGNTLASEMSPIKVAIDLLNSNVSGEHSIFPKQFADIYKRLSPDVAENVKLIADMKQKMDDPLSEGITMADVNKMADAGKAIRQAARNNQLLK